MSRLFKITFILVRIIFAGANTAQAAQDQSGMQPNLLTISTHLDNRLALRCKGPAASSDRQRCGEALYAGGTNGGFDG